MKGGWSVESLVDERPVQMAYYRYKSLHDLSGKVKRLHGVKRVILFCVMAILLPITMLAVPLYIRYIAFQDVQYTVGESDIQIIDKGMSTVWCEGQDLQMNATFNAYLLDDIPQISEERQFYQMDKTVELMDDDLDYWGFFLLPGSKVTLSVCSRYAGARLMLVRGAKNLKKCALLETEVSDDTVDPWEEDTSVNNGQGDIQFTVEKGENIHDQNPSHSQATPQPPTPKPQPVDDVTLPPDDVDDDDSIYISDEDYDGGEVEFEEDDTDFKSRDLVDPRRSFVSTSSERPLPTSGSLTYKNMSVVGSEEVHGERPGDVHVKLLLFGSSEERRVKELPVIQEDSHGIRHIKKYSRIGNSSLPHSDATQPLNTSAPTQKSRKSRKRTLGTKLHRRVRKSSSNQDEEDIELQKNQQQHDSGKHNNTDSDIDADDIRSSGSSLAAKLWRCYGGDTVFTQTLTPSPDCRNFDSMFRKAVRLRTVYEVPAAGYYYYVFYSDNDIGLKNVLYARFVLEKVVYKVPNFTNSCPNSTSCSLPIAFMSNQKVVLEVPLQDGVSDEDVGSNMVLTATCKPRLGVYFIFPVAALVLFLMFAFI